MEMRLLHNCDPRNYPPNVNALFTFRLIGVRVDLLVTEVGMKKQKKHRMLRLTEDAHRVLSELSDKNCRSMTLQAEYIFKQVAKNEKDFVNENK